ncbi:hypothetical protein EJB05_37363, partial [Eragrostis curvula]
MGEKRLIFMDSGFVAATVSSGSAATGRRMRRRWVGVGLGRGKASCFCRSLTLVASTREGWLKDFHSGFSGCCCTVALNSGHLRTLLGAKLLAGLTTFPVKS